MNRRSFLKWLGVGTAGVAVAPSAVKAVESTVPYKHDSANCPACGFQKPELRCTCPVTEEGPMCPVHGCHNPSGYANYANFSQHTVEESIDKIVSDAAHELGYQAGKTQSDLWKAAFDA